MESNPKTFNKPSVAIALYQSKIIIVQTQNVKRVLKIINYAFLICNSQFSFHYSTNFKCFIT